MPPLKVWPAISMTNGPAPADLAAAGDDDASYIATMAPESTMAPLIVPATMSIPVFAEIVPELAIPPAKVDSTACPPAEEAPTKMAAAAALIVPALETVPEKTDTTTEGAA